MRKTKRIEEIFYQGDIRYNDPYKEPWVKFFFKNRAIAIEKETINKIFKKTRMKIKGPQKELKAFSIGLLKERGFEIKGFEIQIPGGIVDVLAKNKNKQIAIECGPCRIDKAIDYLEIPNTELWILTKGKTKNNYIIHKITRHEDWEKVLNFYKEYTFEQLRKSMKEAFGDLKF